MNKFNELRDDLYCQYCNKQCKNLNSLKQHEIRCKLNPDCNIELTKTFDNYREQHGAWNKGLTKDTDERVKRNGEIVSKILHEYNLGRPLSEQHKRNISKGMKNADLSEVGRHSYGRAGYFDNIWFASTYELAYYIFCKDHYINIIRNRTRFTYKYNNELHKYTPDFYLNDEDLYIEIKGYETEKDLAKYKSVKNLKVLYYDDIKHMINYVKDKYNITEIYELYDGV